MNSRLDQQCTLKSGTTFPVHFQGRADGDYPFAKVSDMSLPGNERYIQRAQNYMDEQAVSRLRATVFPPGSTVFAKVGAALLLNRRRQLTVPTIIDNNMMAAIPTAADPSFLFYFLSSVDLGRIVQLGALPSVNGRHLGAIPFPALDLSTQRRVAEILSAVDDAIEQTEALIAKSQQIKAGLMHDLFTRGLTADGKLRPSRDEAPALYKQSPLGWFPKEWDIGRLTARSDGSRTYLKTGPFGSSLKLEHWVEEGIPVVTIGSLGENDFIEDELLHVTNETARRLSEYALIEGDIVFSRVADVGRSAVIRKANSGWIMSSNLLRIHVDTSRVMPDFLQAQLSSSSLLREQIRRKVNSGGRDVANSATLSKVVFI